MTRNGVPVAELRPVARQTFVPADVAIASLRGAEFAISTLTLAELSAGAHAAKDRGERAGRQDRLQWAEATYDALPFDRVASGAYGRVYAAVIESGQSATGRVVDMLIAAVALANDLPLVTRNPADFAGLEGLLGVVAV